MIVLPALRTWFVVHFVADVVFAVPLFFAPRPFLHLVGFTEIDPVTTRLVAAALFGIGIQSYLGRNGGLDEFRAMLNLKVIWSLTATLGLVWSALDGGPGMTWAFVAIFAGFNGLWTYFRMRLREV